MYSVLDFRSFHLYEMKEDIVRKIPEPLPVPKPQCPGVQSPQCPLPGYPLRVLVISRNLLQMSSGRHRLEQQNSGTCGIFQILNKMLNMKCLTQSQAESEAQSEKIY